MSVKPVLIGGRLVGSGERPFIIAEMSGNHNQSLDRALRIVEEAAKAGADAVKLQTYTADTMTLDLKDGEFLIDSPDSLWRGKTLYELYQEAYTPWEWHKPIFDKCRKLGVIPLSSPFDHSAVAFLEDLGAPAYKIASPENIDLPLIRAAASTGKPMIISTGMATLAELDEAVKTARDAGAGGVILLKCATCYPARPEESNLRSIPYLSEVFNAPVGLSDHSLGVGAAIAAVALGAVAIEKHFTLSRKDGGPDAAFSIEPEELALLTRETLIAARALGQPFFGPTPREEISRKTRRSLYIAKDLKPGDVLTKENLRSIRPGLGLPPKYWDVLIGKKVRRAVAKGEPVSWDMIG